MPTLACSWNAPPAPCLELAQALVQEYLLPGPARLTALMGLKGPAASAKGGADSLTHRLLIHSELMRVGF